MDGAVSEALARARGAIYEEAAAAARVRAPVLPPWQAEQRAFDTDRQVDG
jgi:hypothetical protein